MIKKIYLYIRKFFIILIVFAYVLIIIFLSRYYYKNNIYKDKNFSLFISFDNEEFLSGYIFYFLLDKKEIFTFFIDIKKESFEMDNFVKNFKIDYFCQISSENLKNITDNLLIKDINLQNIFKNIDEEDVKIISHFESFDLFIRAFKFINFIKILQTSSLFKIKSNFKLFIEKTNLNFIDFLEIFLKIKRQNYFYGYFKLFCFKEENFDYKDIDNIINKKIKNKKKNMIIEVLNATYKKGLSINFTRKLRKEFFDVENFGNYTDFLNYTYIIDNKGNIDNLYKLYEHINGGIYISFPKQDDFYDIRIILGENSSTIL